MANGGSYRSKSSRKVIAHHSNVTHWWLLWTCTWYKLALLPSPKSYMLISSYKVQRRLVSHQPTLDQPTRRNICILNLENSCAKTCAVSSSTLEFAVSVQKWEALCRIIFNVHFQKRNCISDIKYSYRLNTSPVLSRKLMCTPNQGIKFLEIYR